MIDSREIDHRTMLDAIGSAASALLATEHPAQAGRPVRVTVIVEAEDGTASTSFSTGTRTEMVDALGRTLDRLMRAERDAHPGPFATRYTARNGHPTEADLARFLRNLGVFR